MLVCRVLYFTFISPIMEYGSVVWAGSHQADLEILDKIEIKALHIVTGCIKGTRKYCMMKLVAVIENKMIINYFKLVLQMC